MTISLRVLGSPTSATAAVTAINPAVGAGVVAGDLSMLQVALKPYTTTITTPAGWTKVGEWTSGTVATGVDLGSVKLAVYYRTNAVAGAIGNLALTGANSAQACITTLWTDQAGWDLSAFTFGVQSPDAVNYLAVGATNLLQTTGDSLMGITACDNTTATITAAGFTSVGTQGTLRGHVTGTCTTGNHIRLYSREALILSGPATQPPRFTWTSTTATAGVTLLWRLREIAGTGTPVSITVPSGITAAVGTPPVVVAVAATSLIIVVPSGIVAAAGTPPVIAASAVSTDYYLDAYGDTYGGTPSAAPISIAAPAGSAVAAATGPTVTAVTVGTGSSYRALVMADGPSVYWRLGESSGTSAIDSSGNGLTGTYSSTGVTLGQAAPVVGTTAARFAETSDSYSDIYSDAYINAGGIIGHMDRALVAGLQLGWGMPWTTEFWFKVNSTTVNTFPGLLGSGTGNAGAAAGWSTFINYTSGNLATMSFKCNGTQRDGAFNRTITQGAWHHFAAASSGTDVQLYLDGVADGAVQAIGTAVVCAASTLSLNPATYPALRDTFGSTQFGLSGTPGGNRGFQGALARAAQLGRRLDEYNIYMQWSFGTAFPVADAQAMVNAGVMPSITWEPWDPFGSTTTQPVYSLANIAAGNFDTYIDSWAVAIASFGYPIRIRPMHEMNGDWYPWAPVNNGGSPAAYIAAWQHIHDRFVAAGATNVVWVWSPNTIDGMPTTITSVYPGATYVDAVGIDGYNDLAFGGWKTAATIFGPTLTSVATVAPGKPVYISETASSEPGGDKAAWISQAFAYFATTDVLGVNWFDNGTWAIDTTPAALVAMQSALTTSWAPSPGDLSLWPASLGASIVGGRARVACTTVANNGLKSAAGYNFVGKSLSARIYPPTLGGAAAQAAIGMRIESGTSGTFLSIEVNRFTGLLVFASTTGFNDVFQVSVTYDPVVHAWWRLRELAGVVHWETSLDGVTWTDRRVTNTATPGWMSTVTTQFVNFSVKRDSGTADYAEIDTVTADATVPPSGDHSYDEVAIYPRALSGSRIASHYSNATTPDGLATPVSVVVPAGTASAAGSGTAVAAGSVTGVSIGTVPPGAVVAVGSPLSITAGPVSGLTVVVPAGVVAAAATPPVVVATTIVANAAPVVVAVPAGLVSFVGAAPTVTVRQAAQLTLPIPAGLSLAAATAPPVSTGQVFGSPVIAPSGISIITGVDAAVSVRQIAAVSIAVPGGALAIAATAVTVSAGVKAGVTIPVPAGGVVALATAAVVNAGQATQLALTIPVGLAAIAAPPPTVQAVTVSANATPVSVNAPVGQVISSGSAVTVSVASRVAVAVPGGVSTAAGTAPVVIPGLAVAVAVPAGACVITATTPAIITGYAFAVPFGSATIAGGALTVQISQATLVSVAPPAGVVTVSAASPIVNAASVSSSLTPVSVSAPAGLVALAGGLTTLALAQTVSVVVPGGQDIAGGTAPEVTPSRVTLVAVTVPGGGETASGVAPGVVTQQVAGIVIGVPPGVAVAGAVTPAIQAVTVAANVTPAIIAVPAGVIAIGGVLPVINAGYAAPTQVAVTAGVSTISGTGPSVSIVQNVSVGLSAGFEALAGTAPVVAADQLSNAMGAVIAPYAAIVTIAAADPVVFVEDARATQGVIIPISSGFSIITGTTPNRVGFTQKHEERRFAQYAQSTTCQRLSVKLGAGDRDFISWPTYGITQDGEFTVTLELEDTGEIWPLAIGDGEVIGYFAGPEFPDPSPAHIVPRTSHCELHAVNALVDVTLDGGFIVIDW